MTPFNYKNAYKLAIQTNRELHISLDAYKSMYDESQKEIQNCKAEIARLQEEIRKMRIAQIDPET
jgi:predicted nuclease with TOPRIM domain